VSGSGISSCYLILVIMIWVFLPSPFVSLVYSGLLFLSFISLLLSFYLRFCDSIVLMVSHLARSCGGYVSVGCITITTSSASAVLVSMSAILFHVMSLCPGTHTRDTFSPSFWVFCVAVPF
jgi:hypothetical protein